jgi:hypothetical protein
MKRYLSDFDSESKIDKKGKEIIDFLKEFFILLSNLQNFIYLIL